VGCATASKDRAASSSASRPTIAGELDHALLNIVLTDLAKWDVFSNPDWLKDKKTTIMLHDATRQPTSTLSERRIWSGSRREPIPRDIHDDLMRRNQRAVSLADFTPTSANVRVEDLSGLVLARKYTSLKAFHETYPEAKGFVHPWLPGYAEDGRAAIVRFRFGRSRLGNRNIARYLLERHDGPWQIMWRLVSEPADPGGI
jgi:hypothetical protein